jgi:ribosomal protein S18 acetylase RimI-like enzyme
MNLALLDNPGWYALNSYHQSLAIWGKVAARYQPGTLLAAAMPENNNIGFNDLKNLVENGESIFVVGSLPNDLPGWEIESSNFVPQLICDDLKPRNQPDIFHLNTEDVPDMLDLIGLAQPGPFLPRTIEMGQYFGLRQDGQLVAMAGERLHLNGFCEISAVCTHPDYRGRSYGSSLTTKVAETIIGRGEIPFLHVAPTNQVARKIYKKLGFRLRKEIQLNLLKRVGLTT